MNEWAGFTFNASVQSQAIPRDQTKGPQTGADFISSRLGYNLILIIQSEDVQVAAVHSRAEQWMECALRQKACVACVLDAPSQTTHTYLYHSVGR